MELMRPRFAIERDERTRLERKSGQNMDDVCALHGGWGGIWSFRGNHGVGGHRLRSLAGRHWNK